MLNAENDLERLILSDPDMVKGLLWGKPRNGHPEGKVIYHVNHVLENINKLDISPEERDKLRLIAIIHDSFKYKVDLTRPKYGENHHAMIARRFAEKYVSDEEILMIIETHDDAYNAWGKGNRKGDWVSANERANKLIDRLGTSINLYMKFFSCDNETGDKTSECYVWFENKFKSRSLNKV